MVNPQLSIFPMTVNDLYACWTLDRRCFDKDETYDLDILRKILPSPDCIAYKILDFRGEMKAFLLGLIDRDNSGVTCGSGHILAVGVSEEVRRQGLARRLMMEAEIGFRQANITILHLEVRISNFSAYNLYVQLGYMATERKIKYYLNGEDGFKMVKQINL